MLMPTALSKPPTTLLMVPDSVSKLPTCPSPLSPLRLNPLSPPSMFTSSPLHPSTMVLHPHPLKTPLRLLLPRLPILPFSPEPKHPPLLRPKPPPPLRSKPPLKKRHPPPSRSKPPSKKRHPPLLKPLLRKLLRKKHPLLLNPLLRPKRLKPSLNAEGGKYDLQIKQLN